MAEGDYRMQIYAPKVQDDEMVTLACVVEIENDVGAWTEIEKSRRTIMLSSSSIIAITENGALSDIQKRAQLAALFDSTTDALDVARSDFAVRRVNELITFPQQRPLDVVGGGG